MRINDYVIRDIFYKLYFYFPYISDDKPSYKTIFSKALCCYGITGVTAEIKYINSKDDTFSKCYFSGATSVDVILSLNGYKQDIDMSENKITDIFKGFLRETYAGYDNVYSIVNSYWKHNSEELMFLITKRNNIEALSIKQEVQKNLSEFNDNALRFINELIQNADDCTYSKEFNTFTMLFDESNNEIVISYPEDGFTYADIISLSSINETNKMMDFEKATNTIGEKGRGFKSIFVYFKEVEIESGGYHFKYNIDEASMFQPIYLGTPKKNNGTRLSLRLKDEIVLSGDDEESTRTIDADINRLIMDVKNFYGADNPENLFRNNSIFFTRHFTELRIVFRGESYFDLIRITNTHEISDSKETGLIWWNNTNHADKHVCVGSMEYAFLENIDNTILDEIEDLKVKAAYKINLIGMIKYPKYTASLIRERYGNAAVESIEKISDTMPIIIYGIKDINTYLPGIECEKSKFTGHMYTYLPTSLNLRLPFIFQMPFDLEDNRSCPKTKSKWNGFLLNYIWDKNLSIIRDWYEYIEENSIVDSIYEYLPTKRTNDTTYKKIAFYIDEKFNFDPMGGSKYAAFAKDQINRFNMANASLVSSLFENIEIFKTNDSEKLVSIGVLKILDDWLAAFDDLETNIFWENYRENHSKFYRFIYSESNILSQKIIEFQRFLGKEGIVLKSDVIFSQKESDVRGKIEAEINRYGREKEFEKLKRFADTFLSKSIWQKKYNLTANDEFSVSQIEDIAQWGSNLLVFEVHTLESRKIWVKYSYKDKKKLWMMSSSGISSYKYIKDSGNRESVLYVCIVDSRQYVDSVLDLIIKNTVENMDDVYDCISKWTNQNVSSEDRLYLAGTYYLKAEKYDEVVNPKIKNLFINIDDINQVAEKPSVPGENDSLFGKYSVEWERIRFLSRNSKTKYLLRLEYISEIIADLINPKENTLVQGNDKNIDIYGGVQGRIVSNEEKQNCLDKFKKAYVNIYVNPDYFTYLPEDRNFIKFPSTKNLILRDIVFLDEASESESILPTEFIQGVRKRYQLVKINEYIAKGMNRNVGIIKAVQAYQIYSLIDDSNYREIVGKEGIVYNELLQNVNDYVNPQTGLAIRLNRESDGFYWMTIVYQEKSHQEKTEHGDITRYGFLASDILSIISIGNSAKREEGNKFTGNKGIGFKNVYKIFDIVEVNSNGYSFLMDDSYCVNPEDLFQDLIDAGITHVYTDKNCVVEKIMSTYTEHQQEETDGKYKKKFPIIQVFSEDIDKTVYYEANSNLIGKNKVREDSLTAFRFRLRDESFLQTLTFQLVSSYHIWMIENNKEEVSKYSFKNSIAGSYNLMTLFLHNLSSIYVTCNGVEKNDKIEPISADKNGLEDNWVESDLFWSNRAYITDLNLISVKSDRYERRKNTEEDGIFSHVEVRFCKKPFLLADSKKRTIAGNGLLYVTLPTEIMTGGAVHINIPALETKSDRLGILPCKTNDVSDLGKWNVEIVNRVFSKEGKFIELFNSFTEQNKDIVANYAFLYVPVSLYSFLMSNYIGFESGMNCLKFIPCMTSSGIIMRSLQDIMQSDKTYKLDTYMYQWFDLMDPSFEVFYSVHDKKIEFIYMKDENDWDLINEFKKYYKLQPKASSFNAKDFFKYIGLYWKHYYQKLEANYQKECDRHFSNRINLITAKTGVDKQYTNWQIWKKFYKESMAGKSKNSFIDNMIRAICFDCTDFENHFYFTAGTIKKILNNDKLVIPEKVVDSYKSYLKKKGYKDFIKYYSLLQEELRSIDLSDGDSYALRIIDKYAVAVYTGEPKNELVPVEFTADDIIARAYEMYEVKRLQQLQNDIPLFLMNGNFAEASDKEFFIQLPEIMFQKDSLELSCACEYESLVKKWVEDGYVVSRANIAITDNLYPLGDLDIEFDHLLKSIKDSHKYLELLWDKKLSGAYVNNIHGYWKGKLTNKKVKNEYFALCIELITRFIQFNNDLDIINPEIEYDIELFDSNKVINTCNKLSVFWTSKEEYRDDLLRIELEDEYYDVNPVPYWNEIEMDLTANQRKQIAENYKSVYSAEDVEAGISSFLNHLYMSDENAATVSGYPSGQYLRVYAEDEEAFVLFKDYTESLTLLLKEVFGIKLRKSKFKPLVNLNRYNDLLPIGSQQEYEIVRKQIFEELSCIEDQEEQEKKKLMLVSMQYQISNQRAIRGYGLKCPLLQTNDMVELTSLQIFEYALFGFHIGISLYGSRAAKDLLIKYVSALTVSIQKVGPKKKKAKTNNLFQVSNGNYSFDGRNIRLRGADIQREKAMVVTMINYLIDLLDDISNQLVLDVEMTTDKGAKKSERIVVELTHAHRAIIAYELKSECQIIMEEE